MDKRKKMLREKYLFWLKKDEIIPTEVVRQFKNDVDSLKNNYDKYVLNK